MIEGLRGEVRAAIAESGAPLSTMSDAWMRGHDLAFTKVLAAHHLIGLTWPAEYGGRAGSNVDRLVVTEESFGNGDHLTVINTSNLADATEASFNTLHVTR